MTNDAPERIWAVVYPHHSGKGPPVINASASETNGREYIGKDVADAAVAAAYEDAVDEVGQHLSTPEDVVWAEDAAERIRARGNTDALERVRQGAKAEALREAATKAKEKCDKRRQYELGQSVRDAILALIPDQHKEDG